MDLSLKLPAYAGLVVDLLDRDSGTTKRVMLYPAVRVELQEWDGYRWKPETVFEPVCLSRDPTTDAPVSWTEVRQPAG